MPAAAVLRRPGQGGRSRPRTFSATSPNTFSTRLSGRPAPQDRPVHGARRRRGAGRRTCSTPWPRTRPTSPSPSASSATPQAIAAGRRRPRAVHGSRSLRRMGQALARAHRRWSRRPQPSGRPRCAPVNPIFIPRNHRVEAVIQAAVEQRRLRAVRGAGEGAGQAVRGPAGLSPPTPIRRCRTSACCRRFAGRSNKLGA